VDVPGIRQPIVIVLLLIAFFSAISGKPLDGLLMLLVAAGLAWDAVRASSREAAAAPPGGAGSLLHPGLSAAVAAVAAEPPGPRPALPGPARRPGWRAAATGLALAGGIAYAVVVGSFARFSWPATMAVVGLATLVVVIGWQGPVRARPDPGPPPRTGAALWGGVLLAGGLWELGSLAQQPGLDVTSYAHPTISALTDPVLASHDGRSLALGVWLFIGWYLVRR
jgi:hypothetical protein